MYIHSIPKYMAFYPACQMALIHPAVRRSVVTIFGDLQTYDFLSYGGSGGNFRLTLQVKIQLLYVLLNDIDKRY